MRSRLNIILDPRCKVPDRFTHPETHMSGEMVRGQRDEAEFSGQARSQPDQLTKDKDVSYHTLIMYKLGCHINFSMLAFQLRFCGMCVLIIGLAGCSVRCRVRVVTSVFLSVFRDT